MGLIHKLVDKWYVQVCCIINKRLIYKLVNNTYKYTAWNNKGLIYELIWNNNNNKTPKWQIRQKFTLSTMKQNKNTATNIYFAFIMQLLCMKVGIAISLSLWSGVKAFVPAEQILQLWPIVNSLIVHIFFVIKENQCWLAVHILSACQEGKVCVKEILGRNLGRGR